HVDVSELVKPVSRQRERSEEESSKLTESIVGEVDKGKVLAMVEDLEAADQKQAALGVAHDENVSAWSQRISDYLEEQPQAVRLVDLQHQLNRPLIELWLGALLGGFVVEQRGHFYEEQQIWVSLARDM
ncbi:MAG: hypothetical protein AAGF01_20295, partial [Cyanobacteria bacterium P01_G01_bin.38]